MSNILRLMGMVVMLLVVALAAALMQPEWARDLGLETWNETTLQHALACSTGHNSVIPPDEKVLAMQARMAEKACATAELLDGRLTLFEAAALFRRVNEEYPPLSPWPLHWQGGSAEECLCWQVIDWAEVQWQWYSPKSDDKDIIARLKDELRRHKEQNGKVILPDPAT